MIPIVVILDQVQWDHQDKKESREETFVPLVTFYKLDIVAP